MEKGEQVNKKWKFADIHQVWASDEGWMNSRGTLKNPVNTLSDELGDIISLATLEWFLWQSYRRE